MPHAQLHYIRNARADLSSSRKIGRAGFRPDITGYDVYPVPMKAGDLMLSNSLLAHGIRPTPPKTRSTWHSTSP